MNICISRDVGNKFKEYVKQKNPNSMYGVSNEAERALIHWMNRNDKIANGSIEGNHTGNNKIWILKREIKKRIGKERGVEPNDVGVVTAMELQKAIELEKGGDRRTFIKYVKLLQNHECIKQLQNGQFDIS